MLGGGAFGGYMKLQNRASVFQNTDTTVKVQRKHLDYDIQAIYFKVDKYLQNKSR